MAHSIARRSCQRSRHGQIASSREVDRQKLPAVALALFTVAMADASSSQAKTKSMEDSDDEPEQLQYKVILLGDGATGKTSIAMRFTDDHFAQQYKQTIGLDFFIKKLVLPGDGVARAHTVVAS